MRLESKKYLRDIEQAAGLAGEFLTGKSFHDYASTPMLRAAWNVRKCEPCSELPNLLARFKVSAGRRGWCALQKFASDAMTRAFYVPRSATMRDSRPRVSGAGHHRSRRPQA